MNKNIIDNILHKNDFNDIANIIMENEDFTWSYIREIEGKEFYDNSTTNLFYMVHNLYGVTKKHEPVIDHYYEILNPLTTNLSKMGLKWWRIKCNLFPSTETLQEHALHVDNYDPHLAGIFSLNTCDGYTKFEDGTKIDSVANRFFLFDGAMRHASTTTTNAPARFNINFNFYPIDTDVFDEEK